MPGTLPRARTTGDINEWRERISDSLPNEQEILPAPSNGYFELIDKFSIRYIFDPVRKELDHEYQQSQHPDFQDPTTGSSLPAGAKAVVFSIPDDPEQSCSRAYHFRARAVLNGRKGPWGALAVFRHPIPDAVHTLEAFHLVNNTSEELPLVNINLILPRTATISGRTIRDREAQFTDAVELESPVTELEGAIDDSQTTLTVPTGLGNRVKLGAYYKIDDEIILAGARVDDVVDILRGQFETTPAAHADETVINFYAKILRDQFSANNAGLYGVTVTIPNDERVRIWDFVARPLSRCGKPGPETIIQLDLPPPALIVDLTAAAFFQHIELRWSELPWTAYRYEIYHRTLGVVPIADLDPTATADTELLARPLADHAGEATFQYPVKYDGTLHYFGVRAVDILGGYWLPEGGDTVGPVQPDQSEEDAADDVTDISASEGPATSAAGRPPRARGESGSVITCGFTPPADVNWNRCKIYIQPLEEQATLAANITDLIVTTMTVTLSEFPRLAGWQFFQIDAEVVKVTAFDFTTGIATIERGVLGTSASTHLSGADIFPYTKPVPTGAEGPEAPLVFHWPSIGDVTLYFVSVAAGGTENAILSSPSLTIDLDGQVSPPLEVQNLHAIKTVHGIEVVWSDGLEPDLDHYDVADLGSRTLEAQGDIDDDQIISRIPASPGDSRRVIFEHTEILYEGTIAQGSSTVVLTSGEIHPNRYKPIGTPEVPETLRIVVVDGVDVLSHTDYEIESNTDATIVLADPPTEADTANVAVKFYIGQRIHKIYVRAVNRADLASEWRPVEGTFLEPAATAPDGTKDLGVPTVVAAPAFQGAYYITGRAAFVGDGTIFIHPTAQGDLELRNIGGIIGWRVRVTYTNLVTGSTGVVALFDEATNSKEAKITDGTTPGYVERPSSLGYVYVGHEFKILLPNVEIEMVELAAKNYFGVSEFTEIGYFALPSGPFYTGNKPDEVIEEITVSSPVELDLAKSEVAFIGMADDVTDIDILGARAGRRFTLVFMQGATPHVVTWPSEFKINTGFQPLQLPNHYTTVHFICRSDSEFFMEGAPVNGPYTAP